MFRFLWVLGPLLAVGLLVAVAGGAYEAGSHHHDGEHVVQVIGGSTSSDGSTQPTQVVRVLEPGYGREWHGGFHFGFFLLPLLFIGFLFLVLGSSRRHAWRGYGPGGFGPGGWGRGNMMERAEEWHRQMHAHDAGVTPPPTDKPNA